MQSRSCISAAPDWRKPLLTGTRQQLSACGGWHSAASHGVGLHSIRTGCRWWRTGGCGACLPPFPLGRERCVVCGLRTVGPVLDQSEHVDSVVSGHVVHSVACDKMRFSVACEKMRFSVACERRTAAQTCLATVRLRASWIHERTRG